MYKSMRLTLSTLMNCRKTNDKYRNGCQETGKSKEIRHNDYDMSRL